MPKIIEEAMIEMAEATRVTEIRGKPIMKMVRRTALESA
jgi:hypothetical protein